MLMRGTDFRATWMSVIRFPADPTLFRAYPAERLRRIREWDECE